MKNLFYIDFIKYTLSITHKYENKILKKKERENSLILTPTYSKMI